MFNKVLNLVIFVLPMIAGVASKNDRSCDCMMDSPLTEIFYRIFQCERMPWGGGVKAENTLKINLPYESSAGYFKTFNIINNDVKIK